MYVNSVLQERTLADLPALLVVVTNNGMELHANVFLGITKTTKVFVSFAQLELLLLMENVSVPSLGKHLTKFRKSVYAHLKCMS